MVRNTSICVQNFIKIGTREGCLSMRLRIYCIMAHVSIVIAVVINMYMYVAT